MYRVVLQCKSSSVKQVGQTWVGGNVTQISYFQNTFFDGDCNRYLLEFDCPSARAVRRLFRDRHDESTESLKIRWLMTLAVPMWSRFKMLRTLELDKCKADDLAPLSVLKELRSLIICSNCSIVVDLSPLSALTKLETLGCGQWESPLEDLGPLSTLTGLRHLDFNGTNVTDLSPLSALKELETLDCSATSVA